MQHSPHGRWKHYLITILQSTLCIAFPPRMTPKCQSFWENKIYKHNPFLHIIILVHSNFSLLYLHTVHIISISTYFLIYMSIFIPKPSILLGLKPKSSSGCGGSIWNTKSCGSSPDLCTLVSTSIKYTIVLILAPKDNIIAYFQART